MHTNFYIKNIQEILEIENGQEIVDGIISSFTCPINKDVEDFLKNNAITFAKKHQSITYFVIDRKDSALVGYFTLAIKPINIDATLLSNTQKNKIERVSEKIDNNGKYSLSAYLIAQVAKNFNYKRISGNELLEFALSVIYNIQYEIGGMVVFLESEEKEKLMKLYETNNSFKKFAVRENKENVKLIQLLKIL